MNNRWNAKLYDTKMNFVSQYGLDVLTLLEPKPGERILDMGCGTGDLTQQIASAGAIPTGIDFSEAMVRQAQEKYPEIPFEVADAHAYRPSQPFDAVFSNAALHWMKQPEQVVETIHQCLKPGGRFVAELGGKGNVAHISQAIAEAIGRRGISAEDRFPWYFPSIGEYSSLLERFDLEVVYANLFDRPTIQADGEEGIGHWLESFAGTFFTGFTPEEKTELFAEIADRLKPALFRDGNWHLDYRRLRIMAIKKG